ncbi:phage major capsid protein [Mycolicibacterium celeriflavum]|uniref:Phage capsid-like C-terminal domain-containing protein n=1 Tax=Mycolicibacterium celeriflavum TaxID=1249101 RepID=A0A1X0BLS6_MYCCF|nr:phage major capsid protein [Mycolicibacterium celeriflavum]MCV7240441.1 phage major capsid protein [Mycolicibacterium celeriflavum]ORA43408.1 hypothetical protein BST21_21870 [Mycolicibacterium celeriflavum]BBY43584.1 hypothetical protein MCEL_18790 [Mycolicibacterium celeriflavum]
MNEKLRRLLTLHADRKAERAKILAAVEARGASDLTADETKRFQSITESLRELDADIAAVRDDIARSGRENPDVAAVARATARVGDNSASNAWAHRAADAIRKMSGEARAISSGSVDVPVLVDPAVTPKARPTRLVDLLVNRATVQSNAFEYFRQTVRTNNAAPVADLGSKPTSVFTVEPVEDRARVIAHLSEEIPIRLWQDAAEVVRWLETEMTEGVLDALESQVVSGSGTGENMTGILTVAGTTAVPFATDVVTTLRKGVTALQTIGVMPNAWVVSPADAEAIDLTKEAADGVGFLLDGFTDGNAGSANVFGPTSIQRVVSPSVPTGTAILADWSQIRLYVRESMRLDVDAGGDHFAKNAAVMRAEARIGLGHLRPASFALIDLVA